MSEDEERELEERQAEQSAEDNAREDSFDEGSEPDAQRATPAVGRGSVGNAGLASGSDSTAAGFRWPAWLHRLLGCPNCVICYRHYDRVFRGSRG